eukprot:TRINITY_DN13391_c0_g1_i4.p1 TRINITY_DN13391_c0_g1~~TRINITY_DN13391_c0_g1_i4.p1  ORF type:complete len:243 (+),score=16.67 TRINITY_DN13391_c0_g1_i4:58-729(+)
MASASRTPAPRDRASAQGGGSRLRSATHTVGRGAAHSSCRLLAVSSTTARRSTTPTVGRRGVLAVSTGVHGIQQVLERPRPGGSASSGRWARVAFMGGWDRDDCESDEDVCVSRRGRVCGAVAAAGGVVGGQLAAFAGFVPQQLPTVDVPRAARVAATLQQAARAPRVQVHRSGGADAEAVTATSIRSLCDLYATSVTSMRPLRPLCDLCKTSASLVRGHAPL